MVLPERHFIYRYDADNRVTNCGTPGFLSSSARLLELEKRKNERTAVLDRIESNDCYSAIPSRQTSAPESPLTRVGAGNSSSENIPRS